MKSIHHNVRFLDTSLSCYGHSVVFRATDTHPVLPRPLPRSLSLQLPQALFLANLVVQLQWVPVCAIRDSTLYGISLVNIFSSGLRNASATYQLRVINNATVAATLSVVRRARCRVIMVFATTGFDTVLKVAQAMGVFPRRLWIFSHSADVTTFDDEKVSPTDCSWSVARALTLGLRDCAPTSCPPW